MPPWLLSPLVHCYACSIPALEAHSICDPLVGPRLIRASEIPVRLGEVSEDRNIDYRHQAALCRP